VAYKLRNTILFVLFFFTIGQNLTAQLNADFTIGISHCLQQRISIDNTSSNGIDYIWDFCLDNLDSITYASEIITINDASVPTGITFVYDTSEWYGFISSRSSHSILRLDFGSSLDNIPSITDLGNIDGVLNGPKNMEFIKENGQWYAILINWGNSHIIRLSFPDNLKSLPSAADLGNLSTWDKLRGLDLTSAGDSLVAIVSSQNNNKLTLLNFGNSVLNIPTGGDILDIGTSDTLVNRPMGVRLIKDNLSWFGLFAANGGDNVVRMNFGSNLFSEPIYDEIFKITAPTEISLVIEGLKFQSFVINSSGQLQQLDFDNDMSASPIIKNWGNFGQFDNTFTLDLVKFQPSWKAFTINYITKKLYRIDFYDSGNYVSNSSSIEFEPNNIKFSQEGYYVVELNAYDEYGNLDITVDTTQVLNNVAPAISFSTDNACIDNFNTFTASSSDDPSITSWNWNFGDGNSDAGQIVNHQYGSTGKFLVTLNIESNNGCTNTTSDSIKIYETPVASFDLPIGNSCTNTEQVFINTSNVVDSDSANFKWNFNDEGSSSDIDGRFIFDSFGDKEILLVAEITGCIDSTTQQLSVTSGPIADFSWINNCWDSDQGQVKVQFINSSDTNDVIYIWDFGDGSPLSNDFEPNHTYISPDTFLISLSVESTLNGCITIISDTLIVNANLLANFVYSPPVIENIPHRFSGIDLTSNTDSVINWNWDFGGIDYDSIQNPEITFPLASDCTVILYVETAQGCTDTFSELITVTNASHPTAAFNIHDESCLEENILFSNGTINGDYYFWDFCQNDLDSILITSEIVEITDSNIPTGITVVYDSLNLYGFVSSRSSNSILRLDFGSSLDNTPSITDLGNIDGVLNGPKNMEFIKENGQWYAILINWGNSHIIRLSFPDNLKSLPSAADLGNLSTWDKLRGLDLTSAGDSLVAIVSSQNNNKLTLLNFGNSVLNIPTGGDILDIGTSDTLVNRPMGVRLIKDNLSWFGLFAANGGDNVVRMNFGSNLFSEPIYDEIFKITAPTEISLVIEGLKFQSFVINSSGQLQQLDFDNDMSASPIIKNWGNFGQFDNTFTLDLVKFQPSWKAFTINYITKKLYRIDFYDSGNYVSNSSSIEFEPNNIKFSQEGYYVVELNAYDEYGNLDITVDTTQVLNNVAPAISFSTDNACIDNFNTFTASSSDDPSITSWNWNFGDGNSDAGQTVNHQYDTTGEYKVSLVIDADNGCQNNTSQLINIYDPPVADFVISDTFNCTFNEVQFINNTVYSNPDSLITWNWDFGDGTGTSNELTPLFSYSTGSDYNVTLTATIPGCESDTIQTITITQGPLAAFTYQEPCDGETVLLTNTTLNPEPRSSNPYLWDFGDGNTSTQESPSHLYDSASTYKVILTAWGENGCMHSDSSLLAVHHIPDALMSWELACHDNETQFYDNSSVTNANITSWQWNYQLIDTSQVNDNGSSNNQNPEFTFTTPGEYSVLLEVGSNYGCLDTVSMVLDVLESPVSDFSFTENCLYDSTQFTDLSQAGSGSILTSWTWMIEDVVYSTQHPVHKFNSSGTYIVDLRVRADNLCESSDSAQVFMPELPLAAFTSLNDCLNETIQFTSQSYSNEDSILQYYWDIGSTIQRTGSKINYIFDNPDDYTIKHWILTERGCLDTIQEILTIHDVPIADFSTYPIHGYGASPLEIKFINESSGATSYFWWMDDSQKTTKPWENPVFIYEDTGTYYPHLFASNEFGCTDTVYTEINVVTPVLDVALSQVNKIVQNNQIDIVLTITNKGTVLIDDMEIQVDISGDVLLSEYFDKVLFAGQTLNDTLSFNVLNNPGNKPEYICITLVPNVTGEEEIDLSNNQECITEDDGFYFFNPYPNPTNNTINLAFYLLESEPVEIYISDLKGKIILKKSVNDTKQGLNVVTLILDEYLEGMYLVTTSGKSFKEVRRINIVK
jgi:PKD repeat protein